MEICRRNPFRDQGFRTMDASISKAFKFKDGSLRSSGRRSSTLSIHPNFVNPFGGPGGNAATLDPTAANIAGFGFVRAHASNPSRLQPRASVGRARSIQLGMKLYLLNRSSRIDLKNGEGPSDLVGTAPS